MIRAPTKIGKLHCIKPEYKPTVLAERVVVCEKPWVCKWCNRRWPSLPNLQDRWNCPDAPYG